jgi:hypothetical protein
MFLSLERKSKIIEKVILHTIIRSASLSAKFRNCTVVGLNGTLVEAKILPFKWPKCVCYLQHVSHLDQRR